MGEQSDGESGQPDGREGSGGQSGGRGGSDGGEGGGGQAEGRGPASTAEKAAMVISVGFAVCLLAFAGWQIAAPDARTAPEASVVGTETLPDGDVAVTVELWNPGEPGLVSATVESNCTTPPASVAFSYVPASSTRRGTVVCPPGTADAPVSVANWVPV